MGFPRKSRTLAETMLRGAASFARLALPKTLVTDCVKTDAKREISFAFGHSPKAHKTDTAAADARTHVVMDMLRM